MLSKEICKKCCIEFPYFAWGWDITCEEMWEEDGVVVCPESDNVDISIKEDPPKDCPYILEHIMSKAC